MPILLSYAGCFQLIKSVLNGISQYWTSILKLPQRLINHICQLFSAFLWKGKAESDDLHHISRRKVCKPFVEEGLELRNSSQINLAGFSKLYWRVLTSNKSFWVKWIHGIHIINYSIWHAQPHSSSQAVIAFLPSEVGSHQAIFTRLEIAASPALGLILSPLIQI